MKNSVDLPVSYGGIVFPWRGENTGDIVLTTIRDPQGNIEYALPKGKPKFGESPQATAKRETEEETGIDKRQLRVLSTKPTVDYVRHNRDNHLKHIVLFCMVTDAPDPYTPKNIKRHPAAEAIPLHRAAEYLHNSDDAMQMARIQPILQEVLNRMKGIVTWNGLFAEHPNLAKELEQNMEKFHRSLARK